jgi:phosphatidylinositol alpha-mannosyltransferase
MKICFVLDDGLDRPDGVQQYILTLGDWFKSQGHEVHYIVGETTRKDITNVHVLSRNIRIRFNKNRLAMPLFAARKAISALLQKEQFDVLHVQMPYSPQFVARVIQSAPARTAIIGTFHILPSSGLQRVGAQILSKLLYPSKKRIDVVYSVSPAAQAFASQYMNIQSQVLPNAVDLSSFTTGRALRKYAKTQNVVFLGRLVERKGALELLKAIAILVKSDRFSGRKLILCGTGPLHAKIERFITSHKLAPYVTCTGFITESEKKNYFATAEVTVLPSMYGESFGIVVVEAIASGSRVVLGGDNPGYRYVLNNIEDTLIDPTDSSTFADRIDALLKDKAYAQKLGNSQRQYIKQFDVATVGARLIKDYKSVLANKQIKFDNYLHE